MPNISGWPCSHGTTWGGKHTARVQRRFVFHRPHLATETGPEYLQGPRWNHLPSRIQGVQDWGGHGNPSACDDPRQGQMVPSPCAASWNRPPQTLEALIKMLMGEIPTPLWQPSPVTASSSPLLPGPAQTVCAGSVPGRCVMGKVRGQNGLSPWKFNAPYPRWGWMAVSGSGQFSSFGGLRKILSQHQFRKECNTHVRTYT